nr:hypothetical protein [Tanacetum cinerariifolium]
RPSKPAASHSCRRQPGASHAHADGRTDLPRCPVDGLLALQSDASAQHRQAGRCAGCLERDGDVAATAGRDQPVRGIPQHGHRAALHLAVCRGPARQFAGYQPASPVRRAEPLHGTADRTALAVVSARATRVAEYTLQPLEPTRHDPWAQAMDVQRSGSSSSMLPFEEIEYQGSESEAAAAADGQKSFPTYALHIVNHSPGGYCLAWPKDVPDQLQAGEMIGIQDHGHGWSIAVVRWVRQVRSGGTQMGVELIAPFAQACGMQLL